MSGASRIKPDRRAAQVFASVSAAVETEPKVRAQAKRPAPLSLRLTAEERARLERDAAGLSLSAYVRSRVFDQTATPRRTRGKFPVKDHEALGRVLSALGRSKLPTALSAIETQARAGRLLLDQDTRAALHHACADIAAMRRDLVNALGLRAE